VKLRCRVRQQERVSHAALARLLLRTVQLPLIYHLLISAPDIWQLSKMTWKVWVLAKVPFRWQEPSYNIHKKLFDV
jgi:cytochrome oxidase assembly protein ShyY1